jgi:hypothetical protein
VIIPDGVATIGIQTFRQCTSLVSVVIPKGVSTIKKYAFGGCPGVRYYDFSDCTEVPTLENANAFYSISDDCQMLIPEALYDAWSTATNWTTHASHMVAV